MSKEQGQANFERFRAWSASISDEELRRITYWPIGLINLHRVRGGQDA
jgi:hypothetical protein